ncbi:Hypothetical_protein [Hexamita inflata]|uniref:Hypothetical_protein n=1 Tax=Hexamita inflata TaxID=28002 RepID=A0AA86U0Z8_9EUKA|nr:Hypothetical protein HINF_LOCUS23744 [Hexamita inflata]
MLVFSLAAHLSSTQIILNNSFTYVSELPLISRHKGNCQFALLPPFNSFYVLDVKITVPTYCDSVRVSFAGSVATPLSVSVFGVINIFSGNENVVYHLSPFVGNVYDQFSAVNCYSSLKFYLNNQIAFNSSKVTLYYSNFDGKQLYLIKGSISDTELQTRIENESNNERYQKIMGEFDSTQDYVDFDVFGRISTHALTVERAYYNNTGVTVLKQNGVLKCANLYDPVQKICVSDCEKGIFERFCVHELSEDLKG